MTLLPRRASFRRNAGPRLGRTQVPWRPALVLAAALLLSSGTAALAAYAPVGPTAIVVVVVLALAAVSIRLPTVGFVGAVLIGGTNGFLRRVIDYVDPASSITPVVAVLPAALFAFLAVQAVGARRSQERPGGRLLASYVAMSLVVVFAGVNPGGVGLAQNLGASALLLASMSVFLLTQRGIVGRGAIEWTIVVLGSLNAISMIAQEAFGLMPWDAQWVRTDGYNALYIGLEVRPLGLAAGAAESVAFCTMLVAVAIGRLRMSRNPLWLAPLALGLWGALLGGTRTFVIFAIAAIAVSFAIGRRRPLLWVLPTLAVAAVVTFLVSQYLLPEVSSSGAVRILQTFVGLEDPTTSTIPIHQELVLSSLLRGVVSVIGFGSGAVSILATQGYGSSEQDISNAAIMAGIPGVLAFVWFCVAVLRRAGAALNNPAAAVGVLIAVAMFGQWLQVGMYGATPLVWGALGLVFTQAPGAAGSRVSDTPQSWPTALPAVAGSRRRSSHGPIPTDGNGRRDSRPTRRAGR